MTRTGGALIDDRGRLFGRINLIDAAIGVVVLALIPAAYGTVLLFRAPKPVITSVELAPLTYIEERQAAGSQLSAKLKVRGASLRPVLTAFVDSERAIGFIFETPASADVLVGHLAPGTHDLILYDGVQEVARAKGAVRIAQPVAPGQGRMRLVGWLIDLDAASARSLRVGETFPATGEPQAQIVGLGEAVPELRSITAWNGRVEVPAEGRWQRQAALSVRCDLNVADDCRVSGLSVGSRFLLPVPGAARPLTLRVEEAVPASAPTVAEVRVRFGAHPELADLVKAGDIDTSVPVVDERGATVLSVGARQVVEGDMSVATSMEGGLDAVRVRAASRVASFDVRLRLGLDPSISGWRYRTQLLKVGGALTFVTDRYIMRGTVLAISTRGEADSAVAR